MSLKQVTVLIAKSSRLFLCSLFIACQSKKPLKISTIQREAGGSLSPWGRGSMLPCPPLHPPAQGACGTLSCRMVCSWGTSQKARLWVGKQHPAFKPLNVHGSCKAPKGRRSLKRWEHPPRLRNPPRHCSARASCLGRPAGVRVPCWILLIFLNLGTKAERITHTKTKISLLSYGSSYLPMLFRGEKLKKLLLAQYSGRQVSGSVLAET